MYLFLNKEVKKVKKINMVGNQYGHLLVKEMLYNYNNTNRTYCRCDCDCGNKDIIRQAVKLRNDSTEFTSCGCTIKERVSKYCGRNIDGQRFGRLVVLETFWETNPPKVLCRCDCGVVRLFRKNDVQSGHTQSCGCLTKENTSRASTKDWSGYISESGVKMVKPAYQNENNQWLWECVCPLCNNSFIALPIKIYNNHTTSCGCKRISSGERIIEDILKSYNIKYEKEYSFVDCRNKYKLRFDFAIVDDNGGVLFLIEYDGQQHYHSVEIFGGEKGHTQTVQRDKIKNDYCKDNGIPLLRLNYMQSIEDYKELINKYIVSLTTTGGM